MWDLEVPAESVDVKVDEGWITLTDNVSYQFESDAAYDDVTGLYGVYGITTKSPSATSEHEHPRRRASARVARRGRHSRRGQSRPAHLRRRGSEQFSGRWPAGTAQSCDCRHPHAADSTDRGPRAGSHSREEMPDTGDRRRPRPPGRLAFTGESCEHGAGAV